LTMRFDSFLGPLLEEYVNYRQNLGYSMEPTRGYLQQFDRYVKAIKRKPGKLKPLFFLKMRSDLKMEPRSANRIIASSRVFFQYLVRRGIYCDNPVKDVPYLSEWALIPFIFSESETDRLLEAATGLMRRDRMYFLKDFSQYMSIVLMARCGLRISETIRLCRHQYRADEKTLYIEKTKFKKDRLIPVPSNIWREMDNYLTVRDALASADNSFLLAGLFERSLCDDKIRTMFRLAVNDIGLDQPRQRIGNTIISSPTPHSLRHSFAVNTLKRVKERGLSPQNALPILAVYMGHSEYKHTTKYLKLADADHHRRITHFMANKVI